MHKTHACSITHMHGWTAGTAAQLLLTSIYKQTVARSGITNPTFLNIQSSCIILSCVDLASTSVDTLVAEC